MYLRKDKYKLQMRARIKYFQPLKVGIKATFVQSNLDYLDSSGPR